MDQDTPVGGGQQWRSLYRRFRPQRFEELFGQDHVALALRNAVRDDKVSHAYLFSGPRGTGKTTSARILAKALNCENVTDGEPCGTCDSCLAITRGASFDVHELDAASNNGVDAMRDLVARAALSTPGRWKVYIVDEVHMLSTAASNALLKTLEEPPPHVVFVLATTDPQKVLPTIRSRTQHFEFKLIPAASLETLLKEVAAKAGLDLPAGAIDVAVRRGRGSARDALSVLDQVAAAGITDDTTPALGELVGALASRDTGRAFAAVEQALSDGRDVHRLTVDLVDVLRRGFLLLAAPQTAARLDTKAGATDAVDGDVRELGIARCVRAMETLGATQVDMRTSADPRITLEVALARLTHPEADDSPAAILDRLQRLERTVAGLAAAPRPVADVPAGTSSAPAEGARPALGAFRSSAPGAATGPPATGAATGPPATASTTVADDPPPQPTAAPVAAGALPSRDDVVAAWGDHVLVGLRPKARALFQAGRFVSMDDDTAVLALPNESHRSHAQPLAGEVATALSERFGQKIKLRLVVEGAGDSVPVRRDDEPPPDDEPPMDEQEMIDEMAASKPAAHSQGAGSGVSWAVDRLMEAFPGAEEVGST